MTKKYETAEFVFGVRSHKVRQSKGIDGLWLASFFVG